MKRYLLTLLVVLFIIPFSRAMEQKERPWPEMIYQGKSGANLRLVSLKEVTAEPFVQFATTLFSTKGVFELYENGERWNKERAQRLWNRIFPRTDKWFKGDNSFTPWAVIRNEEAQAYIGILGIHLHTNETMDEYKGVELCFAVFPDYKSQGVISNGFRTYAQTFSPQLNDLEDKFTRVFAPISPINFSSLKLTFHLNFKIGQPDTVDKPYVSSYYKGLIEEEDKPRFEGLALTVASKFHKSDMTTDLTPEGLSISAEDWEKLKALRVVVAMPKKAFFEQFLAK